jgi:hypothetical protein
MQEGFELIVEGGYFRASDITRKRQNQPIPFHCEGGETRLQCDTEFPWPDAIADQDTGPERNGQKGRAAKQKLVENPSG